MDRGNCQQGGRWIGNLAAVIHVPILPYSDSLQDLK